MESSPRNVLEAPQGARSGETSLTLGCRNSLDGSTFKLEVEALLAGKVVADEAKASKLIEQEATLLREALNALQSQKVWRRTALFM